MVLQFTEMGKGEKGLLDMPVQMLGGWVCGYTNLEFWGEAETADRAIRIWKMRNLTEPGKIN